MLHSIKVTNHEKDTTNTMGCISLGIGGGCVTYLGLLGHGLIVDHVS